MRRASMFGSCWESPSVEPPAVSQTEENPPDENEIKEIPLGVPLVQAGPPATTWKQTMPDVPKMVPVRIPVPKKKKTLPQQPYPGKLPFYQMKKNPPLTEKQATQALQAGLAKLPSIIAPRPPTPEGYGIVRRPPLAQMPAPVPVPIPPPVPSCSPPVPSCSVPRSDRKDRSRSPLRRRSRI